MWLMAAQLLRSTKSPTHPPSPPTPKNNPQEAYTKIVESSQTLLHVLKRESSHLLGQSQGGQAPAARGGKSSSSSSSSSFGLSRSLNSKGNAHAN